MHRRKHTMTHMQIKHTGCCHESENLGTLKQLSLWDSQQGVYTEQRRKHTHTARKHHRKGGFQLTHSLSQDEIVSTFK